MRLTGALIFAGAIASVSSILNYSCVDAQTNSTAASGPDISSKAAAADCRHQGQKLRLEYSFESYR